MLEVCVFEDHRLQMLHKRHISQSEPARTKVQYIEDSFVPIARREGKGIADSDLQSPAGMSYPNESLAKPTSGKRMTEHQSR